MFKKNFSLLKFNSFKLDIKCKLFCEINNTEELLSLIKSKKFKKENCFVLGGGTNILFTKNYNGIILKNNILGKEIIKNTKYNHIVKVGAGENWHNFVKWTISKNIYGLENLSLIPGNVGAAPIQNIGAYGIEIKNYIHKIYAIELKTGIKRIFNNKECEFSYRNSIFKKSLKNKYIITNVIFKLNKIFKICDNYKGVKDEIKKLKNKKITNINISNIIIKIRNSKLPNPKKIGNCGSFFKNPIISKKKLNHIIKTDPNIIYYKEQNNKYKISAGWLIENCGFKKMKINNVSVYEKHALVIVNIGAKHGKHVKSFYQKIQKDVFSKYNIELKPEVNII